MTLPKGTGRGRVKGSKNKATLEREREAAIAAAAEKAARGRRGGGILREAIDQAFTAEELVAILRRMPPGEVAKVIASQEPRRKEESAASTFVMIVDGLGSKLDKAYCPRCGWNSDDGFDDIANYHMPLPEIPPRRLHATPRGTQPPAGASTLLVPAPVNAPGSTEITSTERKDAHLPPPKDLPGDFFQPDPAKPEPPVHFNANADDPQKRREGK